MTNRYAIYRVIFGSKEVSLKLRASRISLEKKPSCRDCFKLVFPLLLGTGVHNTTDDERGPVSRMGCY